MYYMLTYLSNGFYDHQPLTSLNIFVIFERTLYVPTPLSSLFVDVYIKSACKYTQ